MKKKNIYALSVGLFIILILLDQWTKALAYSHLFEQDDVILINNVLQFHYLQNTGAAFSILRGQTMFFFILTPLLCLLILRTYFRLPDSTHFLPIRLVCVFLLAGAVGNLIDRIRFGYVIDFIYFSLIDFPVFNVADIYVTCSVTALVFMMLFVYKDDEIGYIL